MEKGERVVDLAWGSIFDLIIVIAYVCCVLCCICKMKLCFFMQGKVLVLLLLQLHGFL